MFNILMRKKPPKGINNLKLDNDQVQTDLIWNLFYKCKTGYDHQSSKTPNMVAPPTSSPLMWLSVLLQRYRGQLDVNGRFTLL